MERKCIFGLCVMMIVLVCASNAWCAQADYDGLYYGTFGGDDTGVWVASADSTDENGFLTYSTVNSEVDGGNLSYDSETSGGVGTFTGTSDVNGVDLTVEITASDGTVSGTWAIDNPAQSGTLTGQELTSCSEAGSYSGSFSGDDSGSWTMTIAETCMVTARFTSSSSGWASFVGACHPDGYVLLSGEDQSETEVLAAGTIKNGAISGTWESADDYEGTFTNAGDDDDSTCFIQSLLNR